MLIFLKGDAGNYLVHHNEMRFSTNDSDNDAYSGGNCATNYKGGWWYYHCTNSNLNGLYLGAGKNQQAGMTWFYSAMKKTKMKIRPNQF